MATIITYDVPTGHTELKKRLFMMGYSETIDLFEMGRLRKIHLPNTTVYHKTKVSNQCLIDITNACNSLNIKLERCITTQLGPDWAAIDGKPLS